MTRRMLAVLVGVVVLGLVGVWAWRGTRRPPSRPNVLIILWDTVRADRLSMYGHDRPTTPRMDAWAERAGVIYEHALSPAMWTVPSHASLFTGLVPTTHGAGTDHRWLDGHHLTLAEHFGAHGYATYAFSANPNLSPNRVNLLQGFDTIDTSWSRRWRRQVVQNARRKLHPADRSTEISPRHPERTRNPGYYNAAPVTHEALIDFLDRRDQAGDTRPFFAYLSYMEAHKPRVPALESRRRVTDDETIRRGLQTDLTFRNQLLYSYGLLDYTDAELDAINRVYDATLVELDQATADLLDALDQRGILDDTIVVFTSDHGEQLGEHGQFGHRSQVYQQLLHVPLVISYPRALPPRRVDTRVSNLDVFGTILALAELPFPDGDARRADLTRFADIVGQTLFAETISIDKLGFGKVRKLHPEVTRDQWANLYRAVVTPDGKKLIQTVDYDDGHVVDVELYDLTADPAEAHDLADARPDDVAALQASLAAWRAGLRRWDRARADLVPDPAAQGVGITPEECAQLELLGYLDERCADAE